MIQRISDYTYSSVANYLHQGFIGGFVWGHAEAGPRALGNRSILADARSIQNKDRINGYIKNRMAFQPLAPVCLEEDFDRFFERPPCDISLEYMLFAVKCKEEVMTKLPAILHADHTARVQVVNQKRNPNLHVLLTEFKKYSGVGVLINTSFNGKGEPIVNTIEQAYNTYRKLDLDFLIIDKFLISNKL
ncbi:carbamoyltransferase C-terminal domain-containing protein [Ekhidna sp.]|uniref:carbamoyltransferase C-terminal domain-containing protein n=1 Tax=Ekhidna sp. TaxID=2608089 RepID=UPI0032987036